MFTYNSFCDNLLTLSSRIIKLDMQSVALLVVTF